MILLLGAMWLELRTSQETIANLDGIAKRDLQRHPQTKQVILSQDLHYLRAPLVLRTIYDHFPSREQPSEHEARQLASSPASQPASRLTVHVTGASRLNWIDAGRARARKAGNRDREETASVQFKSVRLFWTHKNVAMSRCDARDSASSSLCLFRFGCNFK